MNKLFATLAILVVSTAMALATDKVELIKGEFRDGEQMVAVKNNTTSMMKRVRVECGFFRDNMLVGAHGTSITNLLPGQTGYSYTVTGARGVTSVDCRIDSVDAD